MLTIMSQIWLRSVHKRITLCKIEIFVYVFTAQIHSLTCIHSKATCHLSKSNQVGMWKLASESLNNFTTTLMKVMIHTHGKSDTSCFFAVFSCILLPSPNSKTGLMIQEQSKEFLHFQYLGFDILVRLKHFQYIYFFLFSSTF